MAELEAALKFLPLLQKMQKMAEASQPAEAPKPAVSDEPLVGVFWDYENIKLPPNYTPATAEHINARLRSMFGCSLHTKNCCTFPRGPQNPSASHTHPRFLQTLTR
jgi:hypothetical protein